MRILGRPIDRDRLASEELAALIAELNAAVDEHFGAREE